MKNSNFDSICNTHSQKLYACVPPRGGRGENFLYHPKAHPKHISTNIKQTLAFVHHRRDKTSNLPTNVENGQNCLPPMDILPPCGGCGGQNFFYPPKGTTGDNMQQNDVSTNSLSFLVDPAGLATDTKKKETRTRSAGGFSSIHSQGNSLTLATLAIKLV